MSDDKTRLLTADEMARLAALQVSDDKTRILTADEVVRLAVAEAADDGRTRVLSDQEADRILRRSKGTVPPPAAAAVEDHEPKFIGSKIVFFCSNGHKITVDRSLAGKQGKCQGIAKRGCGVAFVIPVPPDVELPPVEPASESGPAAGEEPAPADGVAADSAEGPPATLAFDVGPPPESPPAMAPDAAAQWNFGGEASPADAVEPDPVAEAVGWGIDIDEIDNPTARLVARLWLERAHGGVVEVHLSGGSVIMPEWYDPRWSGGTHALFAAQAADGTLTLTAVAWDQVQRVVVRQVQGTPEGMFEG